MTTRAMGACVLLSAIAAILLILGACGGRWQCFVDFVAPPDFHAPVE